MLYGFLLWQQYYFAAAVVASAAVIRFFVPNLGEFDGVIVGVRCIDV